MREWKKKEIGDICKIVKDTNEIASAEQNGIIMQVEKHLQTVSNLENRITEREGLPEQLMQSILKDAFEGGVKNGS